MRTLEQIVSHVLSYYTEQHLDAIAIIHEDERVARKAYEEICSKLKEVDGKKGTVIDVDINDYDSVALFEDTAKASDTPIWALLGNPYSHSSFRYHGLVRAILQRGHSAILYNSGDFSTSGEVGSPLDNMFVRFRISNNGNDEWDDDIREEHGSELHNMFLRLKPDLSETPLPKTIFWTQGPLWSDKRMVVRRHQEEEIVQRVFHAENLLLRGPRQSGKTTMLYQLRERLQAEREVTYLDMQSFSEGSGEWLEPDLFVTIAQRMYRDPDIVNMVTHDPSSVFMHLPRDSVVLIDEFTDVARRFPAFMHAIRAGITSSVREGNQRPTFILSDRSDPSDYRRSAVYSSPFNVLRIIDLADFTYDEAASLLHTGFSEEGLSCNEQRVRELYEATGGQPYLTQRMGQLVSTASTGCVRKDDIASAAEYLINEAVRGGDPHFTTLYRYLRSDSQVRPLRSLVYRTLDKREESFTHLNVTMSRAASFGFVVERNGQCVIRNPLYEIFLEQVRPTLPWTVLECVKGYVGLGPRVK